MGYMITKEQCADKIRGVCSQCGGGLEPIETVDNGGNPTFWSGCRKCERYDNGVDPEIYDIAKRMVVEKHLRPYTLDEKEDSSLEDIQRNQETQIGGACSIVRNVLWFHAESAKKPCI